MTQVPLSLREQAAIAIAAALAPQFTRTMVDAHGDVRAAASEAGLAMTARRIADALVYELVTGGAATLPLPTGGAAAPPASLPFIPPPVAEPPAPEPAPAPKKAARAAKAAEPPVSKEEPAPAPAAEPPISKEEPAPAPAAITYEDVKALVLQVVKDCGRDAAVKALGELGVTKAPDLKVEDYPRAKAVLEAALAAEAAA